MRQFLLVVGILASLAQVAQAQQPAVLPSAPQVPVGPPAADLPPGELVLGHRYTVALSSGTTFTGKLTAQTPDVLEFDTSSLGHLVVQRRTIQRLTDLDPSFPTEVLGVSYNVELYTGTSFLGVLQAVTPQAFTFETRDIGTVTVQRSNVRQLIALTATQARRGYDDVGNGTRLFFAPTGRGLRKGEGYLQDIDVYIIGGNYGITDNFSIGALIPIIPGLGLNVFAITPKVSVPVADKLNLGVGVLYANAFGYGAGIGYGVATYGSADANVTGGLGYAFASGETSSTPVVVVGGAVRVSRRIFLVDETYIVSGGLGGLMGVRVAASRASGSLGLLYATSLGGIYPAYLEFAYRFGKVNSRR